MRRYARHHQLKIADLAHDITTGTRTLPIHHKPTASHSARAN